MRRATAGPRSGTAKPVISEAGDAALLLRFGQVISDQNFEAVRAALTALTGLAGALDVVPGYASVLVIFDPVLFTPAVMRGRVMRALAKAGGRQVAPPAVTVEVPVFYDESVAADLGPLAREKGLPVGDLIARHTAPSYRCHMIGFRPGFPFLGGLDAGLVTPRLATPRLDVPAGAVAIAGRQTGIYPNRGPGGWRIIGRTPLSLFDPERPQPCLIQAGDLVRFRAIDAAEFARLGPSNRATGNMTTPT